MPFLLQVIYDKKNADFPCLLTDFAHIFTTIPILTIEQHLLVSIQVTLSKVELNLKDYMAALKKE